MALVSSAQRAELESGGVEAEIGAVTSALLNIDVQTSALRIKKGDMVHVTDINTGDDAFITRPTQPPREPEVSTHLAGQRSLTPEPI